jgi:hypothetical protein
MSPALIENPIVNSPYDEPTRHYRFDDGITEFTNKLGDEVLQVYDVEPA